MVRENILEEMEEDMNSNNEAEEEEEKVPNLGEVRSLEARLS